MDESTKVVEIAIDQWIREVDETDMPVEEILASFEALREEFNIPEGIAKDAVLKALG